MAELSIARMWTWSILFCLTISTKTSLFRCANEEDASFDRMSARLFCDLGTRSISKVSNRAIASYTLAKYFFMTSSLASYSPRTWRTTS